MTSETTQKFHRAPLTMLVPKYFKSAFKMLYGDDAIKSLEHRLCFSEKQ